LWQADNDGFYCKNSHNQMSDIKVVYMMPDVKQKNQSFSTSKINDLKPAYTIVNSDKHIPLGYLLSANARGSEETGKRIKDLTSFSHHWQVE
jgi:hypothetical protein